MGNRKSYHTRFACNFFKTPCTNFGFGMRWISFLSRVAFICNVAFLLCVLLQWKGYASNNAVISTLIITGYILAPFVFSPVVNVLYGIALIQKKPLALQLPRWLIVVNFCFLLVQLIFVLFFLYDPFHTQG